MVNLCKPPIWHKTSLEQRLWRKNWTIRHEIALRKSYIFQNHWQHSQKLYIKYLTNTIYNLSKLIRNGSRLDSMGWYLVQVNRNRMIKPLGQLFTTFTPLKNSKIPRTTKIRKSEKYVKLFRQQYVDLISIICTYAYIMHPHLGIEVRGFGVCWLDVNYCQCVWCSLGQLELAAISSLNKLNVRYLI